MRAWLIFAVILSITPLPTVPAQSSTRTPDLNSTFDLGDQDWRHSEGVNLSWRNKGGRPGGFLQGTDEDVDEIWYYITPENWSGNWSPYIGGNFSYDLRVIDDGNGVNLQFDDILIIHGSNGSNISWPGPNTPWPKEPARGEWTPYVIGLNETSFGTDERGLLEIMRDVDQVWIRGEFSDEPDIEGLDNVRVSPPNTDSAAEIEPPTNGGNGRNIEENAQEIKFYRKNNSTAGGLCDWSGAGDGRSSSEIQNQSIILYCEDTAWGSHRAWGTLWDEFVYDAPDHKNRIILRCHVKGEIAIAGVPILLQEIFGNSADFSVYMIVHDATDGIDVGEKLVYSKSAEGSNFFDELMDDWVTDYMELQLLEDHTYQVRLKAVSSASTKGLTSVIVSSRVTWWYDEVKWI